MPTSSEFGFSGVMLTVGGAGGTYAVVVTFGAVVVVTAATVVGDAGAVVGDPVVLITYDMLGVVA